LAKRSRILVPINETDEWFVVMEVLHSVLSRGRLPNFMALEHKYEGVEVDQASLFPYRDFRCPSIADANSQINSLCDQFRRLFLS